MRKESVDFLKELVETPSPSGFESAAQKLVKEYLKGCVDDATVDVHGNLITTKNVGGSPTVMLAGHVDEIGLMVTYINDDGYMSFASIGGIDAGLLAGQRVWIDGSRGRVTGVVGKKPIHLMDADEKKKVPEIKKLWIDIGAKNKKDAEKWVRVGDTAVIAVGFEEIKNGMAVARGFDDKIGSFVVAETMRIISRRKLHAAVYGVSTVQEEIGLRGAKTSAFGISPDVGIAIDVGFATDFPTSEKGLTGEVKMGKGPMLYRGPNINPVVGKLLMDAAEKKKIPYQLKAAPRATGTDANAIQLTKAGVAAALVSIPNRYMHTPVEIVSLRDAVNAAELLAAFICDLRPGTDFTP